jgi:hypothetical protein
MYKVYVRVDENNRIIEINSSEFIKDKDLEGWTRIDAGEGDKYHHAQGNYFPQSIMTVEGVPRYKLVGGEAVERTADERQADIDAIPPPPPDPLQVTQKAATVMFRALAQTDVIKPADALDNALMFPVWDERVGTDTKVGEYLRYEDGLYRVKQAHKIQEHYPPSTATAALYSKVTMPGDIPDWAPGSWAKDVKVKHNGKIWLSMVDNNTWEPGAAGVYKNIWKEVVAA